MSYSVRKTITVPYIDHDYSVSSDGKNISVREVRMEKKIDINVVVDTAPFDRSVDNCNGSVEMLTGTITGFKVANVLAIQSAEKAIVNRTTFGFMSMIEQNVNLQSAGLESEMHALAGELTQQCKELTHRHDVMSKDYNRIKSRYASLFESINKEMGNRIHQLMSPCFEFVKNLKREQGRRIENNLLSMATTGGRESDNARIAIQASKIKQNGTSLIAAAHDYISNNQSLNRAKMAFCTDLESDRTYYMPVILVCENNEYNNDILKVYQPKEFGATEYTNASLMEMCSRMQENLKTDDEVARIKKYFYELTESLNDGSEKKIRIIHRVKELLERSEMRSFFS